MVIFGRKTARGRLRKAARESLRTPAFSSSVDCTPWVIGGLWPTELSLVTAETAPLAAYLKADLQRIVNSANRELHALRLAGMADSARQAAEAHVIRVARDYAARRVESTVRHLRIAAREEPGGHPALVDDLTTRDVGASQTTDVDTSRLPAAIAMPPSNHETSSASPQPRQDGGGEFRDAPARVGRDDKADTPIEPVAETPPRDPDLIETTGTATAAPAAMAGAGRPEAVSLGRPGEAPDAGAVTGEKPLTGRHRGPAGDRAAATRHDPAPAEAESNRQRLRRLLEFVARQEPGLRWAVGERQDGTTVLLTDVAHGWVPPGIALPTGVQLLEPGWRSGNVTALLGPTTLSATYTPGDSLGWAAESDHTESSLQPLELPPVDDLGWLLSDATRWRDGLPRIAHTLARAGAAGTGVADVEVQVLRVHLEIARYNLVAQYPDVDAAQLLSCLLLAATEGIATGDRVSANYHFAWFQVLSTPPVSHWSARRDRGRADGAAGNPVLRGIGVPECDPGMN
ncbi:DUF5631 domain-containing protein [Mycobacterium sp. SM1]|uniref:DUF5631 domain-containing protein n=1 Tax=Mycobacterium sp. SM1 TaxID=2816243 RepID=UPI001BD01B2B|nr:DUF5631 domain-containing protein [Mycobacterium sp. SM1]MBS4728083.1 DUF5631 domain-containing protein [Mycobacterium sp. SM1]